MRRVAVNCRLAAVLCVAALAVQMARAQLPAPKLFAIAPPGGQAGTTIDVALASGADLDEAAELLFSHPGITAAQKSVEPAPHQSGPQPVPGQFQVAINADVPPGVYEVRARGVFGISTPRAFVVGDHPEANETEPNNELAQAQLLAVNAVVNGATDGEAADYFQFEGTAGQTLVIDCWAYRIDSRLDATLAVLDANGKVLARSRDDAELDPRIVFRVPTDGKYFVKLYDFTYQGSAEHFYRLAVRDTPHIEYVFPPAGLPGETQSFTLFGYNLPGGKPTQDPRAGGEAIEELKVDIAVPTLDALAAAAELGGFVDSKSATVDQFAYRLASPRGASNPVRIGLATAPVIVEAFKSNDERDQAQVVAAPCEIAGQFLPARDVDWYAIDAKAGQTYWIEVFASRLGQKVDADLMIEGGGARGADAGANPGRRRGRGGRRRPQPAEVQGEGVQMFDDTQPEIGGPAFRTASNDPIVAWTAPKDGLHRIAVSNLFAAGAGDPRQVYRLSIRPAQPDFRLIAALRQPAKDDQQINPWSLSLHRGGQDAVRVIALRRDGFTGPIQLSAEGLPTGVTASPVTIGADESTVYLPIKVAEDAALWSGEFRIMGRAKIGEADVARVAAGGDLPYAAQPNQLPAARPRVTARTTLAVVADPLAVTAGATPDMVIETSRNAKASIPLTVTRRNGYAGNVVVRPWQLPREMKLGEVTIAGDQSTGAMELVLNGNTPLGEYTIPLQAEATIPYRRNPDAATRAEAEKAAAEKLAADAVAAVAAVELARETAEVKLAAASAALEVANETLKSAEESLAAANETDRSSLQVMRDTAQKAAEQAAAALQEATAARDMAVQAVAEATAKSQAAEQVKQAATQRATDVANAAQPKDTNVLTSAGAVTIRVAAAPLTLEIGAPTEPLRAGQTLELPVKLARLFGFADAVELEPSFPSNVAGVSSTNIAVPAEQNEAKITLTANAEPAVGEHPLLVRAKFKFNGQDMQVEQTISFRVETVTP
jgi:hypothetical protein